MAKLLLRSKDFIKEEVGGSCGFFSSLIYTTAEHSHDFFEFFLITEGRVNHVVNRHKQVLRKGALVFIRPNDLHYYKKINNGDCQSLQSRRFKLRSGVRPVPLPRPRLRSRAAPPA